MKTKGAASEITHQWAPQLLSWSSVEKSCHNYCMILLRNQAVATKRFMLNLEAMVGALTSAAQMVLSGAEKGGWVETSGSLIEFSIASTVGTDLSRFCSPSHNSSANDTGRQHVATRKTARASIKGCKVEAAASCQGDEAPSPPIVVSGEYTKGESGRRLKACKALTEASIVQRTDSRTSVASRCRFVGFSEASRVAATSQHNAGSAASQHRHTSRQAEHGKAISCCSS